MDLRNLHSPADIKSMNYSELNELAKDLRSALLTKLSRHGGHCGPNLGMVEATIALHYVFDAPKDQIVFDVSHQSYVHKMLTGRIEAFISPEHYNDITGYTSPDESEYDLFEIGHTSTSIALAAGLAKARDIEGGKQNVIAVIGDGAMSGGEAFEGLDLGATFKSGFIVVVNDNQMSIAENHGGIYENLALLRETNGQALLNMFKALGYDYLYIKDGNDIESLVKGFESVRGTDHPVVVHINTQKGEGYAPAEADRERFHFSAPFDLKTGNLLVQPTGDNYSDLTANFMLQKMKENPAVIGMTAATPGVFGFTPERRAEVGRQFVDVGIAEQLATGMASGIAKNGGRPVFMVVSSFMQRAYDQVAQDVCINRQPVVFDVFYGGLFGMNDVTHIGFFDIAVFSNIPNLVFLAPTCVEEYTAMLDWAIRQTEHPVLVRVPVSKFVVTGRAFPSDYGRLNTFDVRHRGSQVAVIGAGAFFDRAEQACELLKEKGIDATLINPRYLSGLDSETLDSLKPDHRLVVTLEDGILDGGYGQKIASYYGDTDMKVINRGLAKEFIDGFKGTDVARAQRLDPDQIAADILAALAR